MPICLPAILDIAVYMFVNALTTVSAVVFLYGAQSKLAAISIVHMDESGATAAAAAMATVILLTAIAREGAAPAARPSRAVAPAGLAAAIAAAAPSGVGSSIGSLELRKPG